MSKALVVLDLQKGFVEQGDFQERIDRIEKIISHFKESKNEVIFIKHIDYDIEKSPLFFKKKDNIEIIVDTNNSKVFEKSEPSAFTSKNFKEYVKEKNIDHIFITGFNTEYCCLFTAINAYHEDIKVTFIEDATATVNDEETYEMKGLDIYDFIGTVLDWSNSIEVLYYDEYKKLYTS